MSNITDSIPPPPVNRNPKTRKGRKGDGRQEDILKLKVNESFFIKASIKSASTLRWWARARHPERDFVAETEGKGTRIWRTR